MYTLIHKSNTAAIELCQSGLASNNQGVMHDPYWICSTSVEEMNFPEDVSAPEAIALKWIVEGTEEEPTNVLPEWDGTDGQVYQIPQDLFKAYRTDETIFTPAAPEPAPQPRYRTQMTGAEFSREILTMAEWAAIETLAQSNASVAAWRDVTLCGDIWISHPDLDAGLVMANELLPVIFTEERVAEIRKGLLIV